LLDRLRKRSENLFLIVGFWKETPVDRCRKLAAVTVAGGKGNRQK
jgi:hypothetical protein